MKSSRLLALLLVLQRRGTAKAAELAEELEVSVRTLYRDVAALMAAGVPVWTEPGPQGGIHLVEGWRTRLDGLTADEANALFLFGAPQAVADLGLATVAVSARAKVNATLPPELRGRASRIRERFLLDAPGWFSRSESLEALPAVAGAVWEGRRLDLQYGAPPKRRRVDPLGLVLKAGVWYLVARHEQALRTYRISRIHRAEGRPETFTRPEGFELAAWWAESSEAFDRSLLTYRCRVRVSPYAQVRLPQVVPHDAVRRMLEEAGAPDGEGWRTVDLLMEGEDVAAEQLTALGSGVEVLEPLALRQRLYEVATRMAALNGLKAAP
ncbi:Predicted DNA-binding transcriptional regulator YafY, contains an HTH and WYL domains [Stigmatella aurantiaca]|uniref:Predicted DNA-binding transcriptional regulator YafY, contains an HTH and WYL domains n=1 Tax=Stigmatella aurantiaca TaxID=41 RepID=A0A1H8B7Y8_STIAU|nr:WYL domain-containing protein [Stigmatella aurantiaca]SEM78816.1 Predicted DNA-binding transcriptional regulator YafY, contains an HTH and WYL domains [Stigmatella aurantiaca]